jgi:glutaredoxin
MTDITLLTRPGCHLCEEARAIVEAAASETGAAFRELNVDDDRELRAEYGDMVPVVLLNGRTHGYFHIDPARLYAALRG